MKCKNIEKLLLQSIDTSLKDKEKKELESHLTHCPQCQRKKVEYQTIIEFLRIEHFPEPKPYFWERLQQKLKDGKKYEPWFVWKRWSIKAIPLSIIIILVLAASAIFLIPHQKKQLSPSVLLLHNLNPIQETKTIFEEEKIENKNMKLILLAMEEKNNLRRDWP